MSSNRLEQVTSALASAGRCGIAPYVTAGDGGLDRTLAVLHALEDAGAACVELGVPFSDPIADGPVLQAAAQRALDGGTTLDGILDLVRRYRDAGGKLPILAFSYVNPLLRRGAAVTARALADAGADGLLVPDLPVEEGSELREAALEVGLAPVFFVTPTTSDVRVRRAAEASRGFLYVIGRTGITGASTDLGAETQQFLARVKELSDVPLGVGFGLRTPEQVAVVARHASLAIVGSALVAHIHEAAQGTQDPNTAAARAAHDFVTNLKTGIPA